MSKFKQLSGEVDDVLRIVKNIDTYHHMISTGSVNDELLIKTRAEILKCREKMSAISDDLTKTYNKALVTDEDKATYGEKMREKIKATYADYLQSVELLDKFEGNIKDHLSPLEERERAARAAEEEKRKNEAERAVVQEREAREREEERLRLAAEEREREERRVKEAKAAEMERLRLIRLELERKEREEAREREERVVFAKTLSVDDALTILRDRCKDEKEYYKAISTLSELVQNIADEPSNPQYRHIPKSNEAFQRDVASIEGGVELLYAIGFSEKKLSNPKPGVYYALPEPEMADDPEAWLAWHQQLKDWAEQISGLYG